MISLQTRIVPKAGKSLELETLLRNRFITAIGKQPGFIGIALLRPYTKGQLEKMQASVPDHVFEILSFWRSDEERVAWAASEIHGRLFVEIMEIADSASYTVQTVVTNKGL